MAVYSKNRNWGFFARGATFGFALIDQIQPGHTLRATWWHLNFWQVYGGVNYYAPGSSVLRAGIAISSPTDPSPPTPLANSGADWLDMTTIEFNTKPWAAGAVNDWLIEGVMGPPRKSEAQRLNKNPVGGANLGVWLSWEVMHDTTDFAGLTLNSSYTGDTLQSH